jgi:hypothetical protein
VLVESVLGAKALNWRRLHLRIIKLAFRQQILTMRHFFRSLGTIFRPPFQGLGLIVVLYFAWAHLVFPHNDILRGDLPDPDDYMYLAQVLDWLKGQGWYDNIQHRLDPPLGTPIHFSRFAQLPIAAGVLLFERLGLQPRGAAMITALIEPLILLGCCLTVLRRVAGFAVPLRWAGASSYVALFSTGLLFEFMPGHVDHHGLVILLVLASVGCALRLIEQPENAPAAVACGLILALGLTIALECLPWMLLIAALLGLWSLQQGGKAARGGLIFALALLTGTSAFLLLTRAPAAIFERDILTYSIVYVWLAAGITLPFIGAALAAKAPRMTRWLIGLSLAVGSGVLFLRCFPDLATGPYGGIDPQLLPLLLDEVEEAKPILQTAHGWAHLFTFMSLSLLALSVALYATWKSRDTRRWQWGLIALLLASATGLTIFYQYRFMGISNAFAVVPLTALLQRGWAWAGSHLKDRRKVFAEIGLLLMIGPLPAVILPALFDGRSFNTGFLLFPVDSGHTPCDMAQLTPLLRDPHGLGDHPPLIASMMELGPELLFRTDDQVLAAPYHMNVQGNLDAARLLSTPYAAEAGNIAKRRGIELIVACRAVPGYYLGAKKADAEDLPMIERLFKGPVPDWLTRVDDARLENFVIYRVTATARENPAATK